MNLLISACLLGVSCRYDGRVKLLPGIQALIQEHTVIPVCPEILGGLPTPRTPAERVGDKVMAQDGTDVTGAYRKGAFEVLKLAQLYGCRLAILKERSPSCGSRHIYDGTFNGVLTAGFGVTAELLQQHGIQVLGESQVMAFFDLPRQ